MIIHGRGLSNPDFHLPCIDSRHGPCEIAPGFEKRNRHPQTLRPQARHPLQNHPSPMVSTMVESPMSGLASASVYPGKYKSFRHLYRSGEPPVSPVPLTRMPKSVPLRHMAVTIARAVNITYRIHHRPCPGPWPDVQKKLIVAADEGQRSADKTAVTVRRRFGHEKEPRPADARPEQATLRWCISSPIVSPRATRFFKGMPPAYYAMQADRAPVRNTSRSQRKAVQIPQRHFRRSA